MASPALLRSSTSKDLYVCARCALRCPKPASKVTKRWIGMKFLAKMADAEYEWQAKASMIRLGQNKSMLTILEERGLINQIAGSREDLDKLLTSRRIGAYVGVDPTAHSLHVGHMVPFMALFWMYAHGYHAVSLLGTATAKIGDPTGRLKSREKEKRSVHAANMANMHLQLKKLWLNVDAYARRYGHEITWAHHRELVNNNHWWNSLPMLEVLQLLGPGVRLGTMLAKDTVKNKMREGDGMSWAEFTYPIMQAWDWWFMFWKRGISIQIGGSDQYGNITAGVDAVKYLVAQHPDPMIRKDVESVGEPMGFTTPLLTTASGEKFGKSAGNAIWLDGEQTTAFQLYGFFLKTADADVGKYLKMFTFVPIEEIDTLVAQHMEKPHLRTAQHKLASEFVSIVHGDKVAKESEEQHRLIFSKPGEPYTIPADLAASPELVTYNNRPQVNIKLPHSLIFQRSAPKILHAAGLAETHRKAHLLIDAGGAYVGGPTSTKNLGPMPENEITWKRVEKSWEPGFTKLFLLHGDLLFLRRGRPHVKIVQVVTDEEYVKEGLKYPGEPVGWREHVLQSAELRETMREKEKRDLENGGVALLAESEELVGTNVEDLSNNIKALLEEDERARKKSSG